MRTIFFIIIFLSLAVFCKSQYVFNKLYNYQNNDDFGVAVIQTFDNGFITTGVSSGDDAGLLVVKTDVKGDTIWQRNFEFSPHGVDDGNSVIQLSDSSFSICGTRYDSTEQAGDTYILSLSSSGQVLWYKSIDAGFNDEGVMHKQTFDGGFIIGGYFYDSTFTHSRVFLLKTDNLGNVQWQKNYGDFNYYNFLESIDITSDGGFIIGGKFRTVTNSNDLFLLKTDSLGNQQWRNSYGSTSSENRGFTVSTSDKGFIIVGDTRMADNTYNGYIVKTDSLGITLWSKIIGAVGLSEYFKFVKQLPDGSYIVAAGRPDLSGTPKGQMAWLLKFNQQGDTLWTKSYNYYKGSNHTYAEDLSLTSDGGFIMTGYTIDINIPLPSYKNDLWLLKTDSLGNTCIIDTLTWKGCSSQDCNFTQAAFTVSSDTINLQVNDTIHFYNNSTFADQWIWNFGDNTLSTLQNPFHVFTSTGTFTVMLVASLGGCADTAYHAIVVRNIIYTYSISGTITYSNAQNTPLNSVKLYLKQNNIVVDSTITDSFGSYIFSSKPIGVYTISATSTKLWSNINATDVLLIDRHIAGLSILSEPKLSAADVNFSNNISSADALMLKLRVASLIDSFPSGDWYFNPQPITITNSDVIMNFNGICYGDVNGSYVPLLDKKKLK